MSRYSDDLFGSAKVDAAATPSDNGYHGHEYIKSLFPSQTADLDIDAAVPKRQTSKRAKIVPLYYSKRSEKDQPAEKAQPAKAEAVMRMSFDETLPKVEGILSVTLPLFVAHVDMYVRAFKRLRDASELVGELKDIGSLFNSMCRQLCDISLAGSPKPSRSFIAASHFRLAPSFKALVLILKDLRESAATATLYRPSFQAQVILGVLLDNTIKEKLLTVPNLADIVYDKDIFEYYGISDEQFTCDIML
jgi:hypothetical protein